MNKKGEIITLILLAALVAVVTLSTIFVDDKEVKSDRSDYARKP